MAVSERATTFRELHGIETARQQATGAAEERGSRRT
jgi:hypothetical protein